MLKCFGAVGLARLQAPLVKFLIFEAFATRTLSNCQRSCRTYWLPAVIVDQERLCLEHSMKRMIQQYWMLPCDLYHTVLVALQSSF